jgi:hypothetical protein
VVVEVVEQVQASLELNVLKAGLWITIGSGFNDFLWIWNPGQQKAASEVKSVFYENKIFYLVPVPISLTLNSSQVLLWVLDPDWAKTMDLD